MNEIGQWIFGAKFEIEGALKAKKIKKLWIIKRRASLNNNRVEAKRKSKEIKRNQKIRKWRRYQPRHLNKERRRDASPTSMKHYVASTLPFFPLIMATWRFTILQLSILDSILPDSSGFFQILLDAPRLVAALVLLPFLLPIPSYQTPFRHIFSYFLPLFCVQTATTHSSNKALIKKPSYIGD